MSKVLKVKKSRKYFECIYVLDAAVGGKISLTIEVLFSLGLSIPQPSTVGMDYIDHVQYEMWSFLMSYYTYIWQNISFWGQIKHEDIYRKRYGLKDKPAQVRMWLWQISWSSKFLSSLYDNYSGCSNTMDQAITATTHGCVCWKNSFIY